MTDKSAAEGLVSFPASQLDLESIKRRRKQFLTQSLSESVGLSVRLISSDMLDMIKEIERPRAEVSSPASQPGFARCSECGNLAMNPLPSCGTCGTVKTPYQQALYRIGAMAMLAQSDPFASAEVYRKALIDICNYALKAQKQSRAEVSSPARPEWAPGIDVMISVNQALHAVKSPWRIDVQHGQAVAVPTPDCLLDLMAASPARPQLHKIRQHLSAVMRSPDWADLAEILDWYKRDVSELLTLLAEGAASSAPPALELLERRLKLSEECRQNLFDALRKALADLARLRAP